MTDVEFKVARSGVRPHRVAILIPANSGQSEWFQVIETCSQLWGGMYCVVVPTDGGNISDVFWELLDIYDPDIIVRFPQVTIGDTLATDILRRLNPFPSRGGNAYQYYCDPISPDNIPYPLVKVCSVVDSASFKDCVSPVIAATPIVEVLAHAYLGRLTLQIIEELKTKQIAIGHPDFDLNKYQQRGRDIWNIALSHSSANRLDEWGKMPRDLASVHLGPYADVRTNWYQAPVELVIGQTTGDFCLFYSLSHLRPNVFWLPTELLDAVPTRDPLSLKDVLVSALFHLTQRIQDLLDHRSVGRGLLVTSMSCNREQVDVAMNTLERTRLVKPLDKTLPQLAKFETNVPELLRYRYTAWEVNNYLHSTPQTMQVVGGESTSYLEVRPKHLKWTFDNQAVWVSEIAVDQYQLPRRAIFNDKALSFDGMAPDTRVTSTGIAFNGVRPFVLVGTDIDAVLARPRLKAMKPLGLIGSLFAETGYDIEISEKGAYQEGTLVRLGGIEAFVDNYFSPRWKIIEKFLDPSPNQDGVHDQGMMIRDRRYLDTASIARQLEPNDDSTLKNTIGTFMKKGVLQRGFALKCPECRQNDWYGVSEVGDRFRCSRCGGYQEYEADVPWVYRLDELVYQCIKNRTYSHILTLAAIKRRAERGSFMFVPAFNVFKRNGYRGPWIEVDIACVVDGEIVVGECKTTGSFDKQDKRQLDKYEQLAKALNAHVLVLSTTSENWSEESVTYFHGRKQQLSQHGVDLRPLSGGDLRPVGS